MEIQLTDFSRIKGFLEKATNFVDELNYANIVIICKAYGKDANNNMPPFLCSLHYKFTEIFNGTFCLFSHSYRL